jgi:hypothetical protein
VGKEQGKRITSYRQSTHFVKIVLSHVVSSTSVTPAVTDTLYMPPKYIYVFRITHIEGKIEGRIEMTGGRGRRRRQLLDDLKEKRRYWKLKEEALDRTQWRTRFGRGNGPVVRQTTE